MEESEPAQRLMYDNLGRKIVEKILRKEQSKIIEFDKNKGIYLQPISVMTKLTLRLNDRRKLKFKQISPREYGFGNLAFTFTVDNELTLIVEIKAEGGIYMGFKRGTTDLLRRNIDTELGYHFNESGNKISY